MRRYDSNLENTVLDGLSAGMAGSSGGQSGEIVIRSVPRASVARIDLGETRIAYCAHATRFFHRTLSPSQASATTRGMGLEPVR